MKKLVLGFATLALTTVSWGQNRPEFTYGTPRYTILPPKLLVTPAEGAKAKKAALTPLTTFNGSFIYNGTTYKYNMVGHSPSSNETATIPVFIIPIRIMIPSTSAAAPALFDPARSLANGYSVTENVVTSPLFDATTTYTEGKVTVGTTQYIDAYARANFWHKVESYPNYHILLGTPTVLPEQTLTPPAQLSNTGTPLGQPVALVDLMWYDSELHNLLQKFPQITPNSIPIFLTYDTYLTYSGVCCYGGYHSSTGSLPAMQAYITATYDDWPGRFSQDVSGLSHELAEWFADPLVVNVNGNNTPCGTLEVADPLEMTSNYGGYPYTLHGFSYNLQDLTFLPYFGAWDGSTVNDWFTFHDQKITMCQNGG